MGIWRFKQLADLVDSRFQLSLKEGDTLTSTHKFENLKINIKEEFRNPNKSFKDRSLAFWISKLYQQGIKEAVISSSGNAAISAAAYCELAKIKLHVFISKNTDEIKKKELENFKSIDLNLSDTPKSDAIKFSSDKNLINLRGSVDDDAVVGFKTLAYELIEFDKTIDAIFIPCSSGASTLGVYQAYKESGLNLPQIHICQTVKVNPMAREFDYDFVKTDDSLAKAISDRVAHRKSSIINAVKESHGFGWVISDEDLFEAEKCSEEIGIDFKSYNSFLAFSGLLKAIKKQQNFKNPCLIYSGT